MKQIEAAINLVENGKIEEGLSLLKEVQKNCNDEEMFTIGELLHNWGYLEDAKNIFEELSLLYPEEGEVLLFLAEIYIDLEDEEKAIAILENIQNDDPIYANSLLLLADLYQMQGLYEVSEHKLLKAKEILPNEPIIHFALAELYLSIGSYQKSLSYYKAVLPHAEQMGNVNINQRIAASLTEIGEFEDALFYYDKALKEKLEINTLFEYGFTAFHAGYPKTTIDKLTALKELDPQYTSLYLYLAKAYELEGMFSESFEVSKEGLKLDKFNKELIYFCGKMAITLGKYEEAEAYLREALSLDPAYIDAAVTLGRFLRSHSKYEEIIELVEEINKYGDIPSELEWNLANAKNQLEFYDDALKHYRHAYTSLRSNIDFLEEYGYALLEDGNRARASVIFKELLKLEPSHAEIAELILNLNE